MARDPQFYTFVTMIPILGPIIRLVADALFQPVEQPSIPETFDEECKAAQATLDEMTERTAALEADLGAIAARAKAVQDRLALDILASIALGIVVASPFGLLSGAAAALIAVGLAIAARARELASLDAREKRVRATRDAQLEARVAQQARVREVCALVA